MCQIQRDDFVNSQMLQNEYLIEKIAADTAEHGPILVKKLPNTSTWGPKTSRASSAIGPAEVDPAAATRTDLWNHRDGEIIGITMTRQPSTR